MTNVRGRDKKNHLHKDWQATQKGQNITDI